MGRWLPTRPSQSLGVPCGSLHCVYQISLAPSSLLLRLVRSTRERFLVPETISGHVSTAISRPLVQISLCLGPLLLALYSAGPSQRSNQVLPTGAALNSPQHTYDDGGFPIIFDGCAYLPNSLPRADPCFAKFLRASLAGRFLFLLRCAPDVRVSRNAGIRIIRCPSI
ncbi:hypothetical protein FB451DRAFT_326098 [Mycena latifolia]|nr:hypothetical protein FB451DRAFT_326098 [Mycena latifolia]